MNETKIVFYVGRRDGAGNVKVRVESHDLDRAKVTTRPLRHVGIRATPKSPVRYHSPSGFNYGYSGSGPADLALAILADALGDRTHDLRKTWPMHQEFKREAIATLANDSWRIPRATVLLWVEGWKRTHPDDSSEQA